MADDPDAAELSTMDDGVRAATSTAAAEGKAVSR
jgi:hypothetical protein